MGVSDTVETHRSVVTFPDYPGKRSVKLLERIEGLRRVVNGRLVPILRKIHNLHDLQRQKKSTRTTQISLKAPSFSSDMTSSAKGINCRLYGEIVTSPNTPSSSSIRVASVDFRGTKSSV
jgi:hypothetical protein